MSNASVSSNWPNVRLRDVVKQSLRPEQRAALETVSQVNFFPMEAIGEGELDSSIVRDKEEVDSGYTQFFDGDVIVAKITPCFENGKGAVVRGLLNGVGFGTTELHVLRPKPNLDSRFLYYVTASYPFRKIGEAYMTGAAGQKRVPTEFVLNYRIALPPFPEQRAIANYLDRETAKLDALIAAKEHLLDLLAEKRRALITHAVTRGLNPEATMRDSGVEWLGEIPKHWEIIRIKYLAQLGNGSTPLRDNEEYWQDGIYPWLTSTVVNDDIVGEPTQFVTETALHECHLPIIQPNSILVAITGQGKTRGKAAILPYQATINQHLAFISPQTNLLYPEFLQLFLTSSYKVLRMISEDTGSTRGALTIEQLAEFPVPLPPISEQYQIISNVVLKKERLDLLAQAAVDTIELLYERRAALIAAAVSGKIRVGV